MVRCQFSSSGRDKPNWICSARSEFCSSIDCNASRRRARRGASSMEPSARSKRSKAAASSRILQRISRNSRLRTSGAERRGGIAALRKLGGAANLGGGLTFSFAPGLAKIKRTPQWASNAESEGYLVEPFVGGVEFGVDDDEDLHAADGPVAGARADHDTGAGADVEYFVVELHLSAPLTLQKVVGLGQAFVVVQGVVEGDFCDVDRAGVVVHVGQAAAGGAARAGSAGKGGEVDELVRRFFNCSWHGYRMGWLPRRRRRRP